MGTIHKPIVNPHNLHIDGFWCSSSHSIDDLVLLDIDVRELSAYGVVIDDHLKLSEPGELVRLESILELDFQLLGKPVYSGKRKIGKVAEYAIDQKSLFIIKLYIQPGVWQSIGKSRLVIDRQSVIEVTEDRIVVSSPEESQLSSIQTRQISPGYATPSANASAMSE